jgi:hypothetical protein
MLTAYQTALVNLLQAPQQPTPLISPSQQTVFINTARGQVAAEGECVRVYGSLTLTVGQRSYTFAGINVSSVPGVSGVNNLRTLWYLTASGQVWVPTREFEWFGLYNLNNPVPGSGAPKVWAQLGQGQAGTIFIDPLPDLAYVCPVDLVGVPVPLVDDSTVEAIPALWTDAVPFYAAWLAFKNLLRFADAEAVMTNYKDLVGRARAAATPSILPGQNPQAIDPVAMNRLGLSPPRGGGGQAAAGAG